MTAQLPPPLRAFTWRTVTGDDDLPDDRFADHINNARYFHYINRCFRGWYTAMGIRDATLTHTAVMARTEYDFLREVKPPSWVECRMNVVRVGRSSMDHVIEIYDLGLGVTGQPQLAGRGKVSHVWIDRKTRQSAPWPPELLALCWQAHGA